ncbi:hypothetical protein C2869_13110 [Saccharobesus litoralis]|uniref:OmpA-like domain-containing protein n=1 Tax=Saccharobesus litoralis TaxID=2172099 RepID=A0A2S0VY12_9ALTE|nr:OmpA family protein [Saccharobesus litoralis]AWB69010.1 hypothetical protein C2869_13110 [Saccharobesus litoralis]
MKNFISNLLLCFGITTLFIGQVAAEVRQYHAKLEKSAWQLSQKSKLQCTLAHKIPRYGDALFTTYANRELNLAFELDMLRLPHHYGVASVQSVAPEWRPGVATKSIADMKILKQFNGEVPQQAAWTMLTELEKGMLPTVYYADWANPYDKVAVSLNSINFHSAYDQFLNCVDNLLPYSFDDISFTILNYKKNSSDLTTRSKQRLGMIGEYLKADAEMELVLVTGFTDSFGGRYLNEKLSKKRAEKVKSFFVENGVEAERVTTTGMGEKRHIDSNKTILGRERNRRVVIQLNKEAT